VCCSVLQCVHVGVGVLVLVCVLGRLLQCVAVCCSVLQCVVVYCSVFMLVLEYLCLSVSWDACCSVLQCVAVCCSVLHCSYAREIMSLLYMRPHTTDSICTHLAGLFSQHEKLFVQNAGLFWQNTGLFWLFATDHTSETRLVFTHNL